ncbi:helix-turn-helix domain-containing protein [Luteimonas sp. A482]
MTHVVPNAPALLLPPHAGEGRRWGRPSIRAPRHACRPLAARQGARPPCTRAPANLRRSNSWPRWPHAAQRLRPRVQARRRHTPAAYVLNWRPGLAATRLRGGRAVKQVAHELGFAGAGALSKAYRRRCGMSPTVLRPPC